MSAISRPGPRWRWPRLCPMPASPICAGPSQGHARRLSRDDLAQGGLAVRLCDRRRQPRRRRVAAVAGGRRRHRRGSAGNDRFPLRGERQGRRGQGRHRQQADDSLAAAQRPGRRSRRPPGSRLGVRPSAGRAGCIPARPPRRVARGRPHRPAVGRHLRTGRVHRSDRRREPGRVLPR